MGNDNTASYARIGFAVVAGVAAIIITLVWLGGLGSGEDLVFAETAYSKSVSGLSVGSAVNFRGVKIGEVSRIGFVGDEYDVEGDTNQLVYVLMAFPRRRFGGRSEDGYETEKIIRALVKNYKAHATVTASGITGLSRIELDFSQQPVGDETISWKPRYCYVPPGVSLLDNFSDAATKVMNQINQMDINSTWSNINASVESLAHATESAKVLMATRQADIERLANGLSETVSSARDLADELKSNPSLLIRERIPRPLPETERP